MTKRIVIEIEKQGHFILDVTDLNDVKLVDSSDNVCLADIDTDYLYKTDFPLIRLFMNKEDSQ